MRGVLGAALPFVGLVLAGCGKRSSGTPPPTAVESAAPVASVAAPGAPGGPARAKLSDPAVRALVSDWLAAQNQGTFAAYERLYAARFAGIKRSGIRVARFDREGWLRDRKGMFSQPMQVEAAELAVAVTPDVAVVTFRQTWSSGSYRDVGPKQLVIVTTAEGLRIAREEMLSSELVATPRVASEALHLVTPEGIVLEQNPEGEWALGPARRGSRESIALRSVREESLPEPLRAWKGRTVRSVASDGGACETTVTGFALRAEVVPHFGSVQSWHGQSDTPALTPPQIAEEIWSMAGEAGSVLIGEVAKDCGGLWAFEANRPTPPIVAPVAAPARLAAKALEAVRALPDYAKIQADFRTRPDTSGAWDDYRDNHRSVFAFHSNGKLALVSVFISAGAGCGDFEGSLGALFAPRPGDDPALDFVITTPRQAPSSAFDLDGDGSLEILFGSARESDSAWLYRRTAKGPQLDELFGVPFLDCGC